MNNPGKLIPPEPDSKTFTFLKELVKYGSMGAASPFIETFLNTSYSKRLIAWQQQVAIEIEALGGKMEEYKFDNLLLNEEFISTFVRCVEVARRNHREEKREYLKNAIINSVQYRSSSDLKPIFVRYIDELTVDQFYLIKALSDHPDVLGFPNAYSALISRFNDDIFKITYHQDVFKLYLEDFKSKGLIDISSSYKDFEYTHSPSLHSFMEDTPIKPNMVVLDLAKEFLDFILKTPKAVTE